MKTKTYTVYKWDELPKKAKEKALERYRLFNVDDSSWYESTLENWKEKLTGHGFKNAEIYFSGFSSQGDGACFNAEIEGGRIVTINTFYNHEHTRRVEHDDIKTEKKLEALRLKLCGEIYRDLETEYDYMTADNTIIETFRSNDYDFTEDGKID